MSTDAVLSNDFILLRATVKPQIKTPPLSATRAFNTHLESLSKTFKILREINLAWFGKIHESNQNDNS